MTVSFYRKTISLLLASLLSLCLFISPSGYAEDQLPPLSEWVETVLATQPLASYAALAFDINTGEIVYSQHADERLYMASLTKIMTALVITERYNLNQMITAKRSYQPDMLPHNGPQVLKGGSIKKGESFYAGNLFKTMMIYSANDATLLFADTIAGSKAKFVTLMNQKALALGMTQTRFTNPHGLSTNGEQNGQYTTARDVHLLMKAALKNPTILSAVQLKSFTLKSNYRTHTYSNTNLLLESYEGSFGLKTGSTSLAGSCLASAVHKASGDYAIVTLKGPSRSLVAEDHKALYDAIQQAFELREVFSDAPIDDSKTDSEPPVDPMENADRVETIPTDPSGQ